MLQLLTGFLDNPPPPPAHLSPAHKRSGPGSYPPSAMAILVSLVTARSRMLNAGRRSVLLHGVHDCYHPPGVGVGDFSCAVSIRDHPPWSGVALLLLTAVLAQRRGLLLTSRHYWGVPLPPP